jgi:cytochrome c oxidase subunit IV
MADGKKGKGGDEAEAKAAEAEAAERSAGDHGHDDHGHGGHGHGAPAPAAHGHKPNIREYLVIFAVLAALTVLEVAVAKVPGVAKGLMALALVGLALTKAAIVALYYMHLKQETKVLKMTVAIPMAAPTIYAIVLISEAGWRLLRP